jgi:flagellar motor protein MotB
MRRRRWFDVWPAYADLMTVLAVVGLFTTVALARQVPARHDLARQLRQLELRMRKLSADLAARDRELAALRTELARRAQGYAASLEQLRGQVREAARNEQMFHAIQEAQGMVDQISTRSGLAFSADQSLEFGDDLVTFQTNSTEPIWRPDGRRRLLRFCQAISAQLGEAGEAASGSDALFVIEVEGHTDSAQCPGDPNCNWWISSGRAASFVAVMRQPATCPGGKRWNLRPIGYADTKPPAGSHLPSRRIAVRLTPNYRQIITSRLPAARP